MVVAKGGFSAGLLKRGPRPPLGATDRFCRGHEQRPLLNNAAVILQNLIDGQGATSVESLWKGPQTMKTLRTGVFRETVSVSKTP